MRSPTVHNVPVIIIILFVVGHVKSRVAKIVPSARGPPVVVVYNVCDHAGGSLTRARRSASHTDRLRRGRARLAYRRRRRPRRRRRRPRRGQPPRRRLLYRRVRTGHAHRIRPPRAPVTIMSWPTGFRRRR